MTKIKMSDKDKFEILLQELNEEPIVSESLEWEECFPTKIYDRIFDDIKHVGEIVEESDRWCTIVTSIIKVYGKYLGVTHVSEIHNNNTDISECLGFIKFKEMKQSKKSTFTTK